MAVTDSSSDRPASTHSERAQQIGTRVRRVHEALNGAVSETELVAVIDWVLQEEKEQDRLDEEVKSVELSPESWSAGRRSLSGRAPSILLGTSPATLDQATERLVVESNGAETALEDDPFGSRPASPTWTDRVTMLLTALFIATALLFGLVLWFVMRFSAMDGITAALVGVLAIAFAGVGSSLLSRWIGGLVARGRRQAAVPHHSAALEAGPQSAVKRIERNGQRPDSPPK